MKTNAKEHMEDRSILHIL